MGYGLYPDQSLGPGQYPSGARGLGSRGPISGALALILTPGILEPNNLEAAKGVAAPAIWSPALAACCHGPGTFLTFRARLYPCWAIFPRSPSRCMARFLYMSDFR